VKKTALHPIVGIHACEEALRARPESVAKLWVRQNDHSESIQRMIQEAKRKHIPVEVQAPSQLNRISQSHQGVCIWLSGFPQLDWESLSRARHGQVLILDGIEDPQNLGAILRTGWLMGILAVFVPQDRAVKLTATVAKVASGGAEHVPVEYFSSLNGPAEKLKSMGFWIYGLAEEGTLNLWDMQLPEKVAWVIGAEDRGIRAAHRKLCDELVRIPQVAGGSSYNASVATALACAEGARSGLNPK